MNAFCAPIAMIKDRPENKPGRKAIITPNLVGYGGI
jgi:hypothetical protein